MANTSQGVSSTPVLLPAVTGAILLVLAIAPLPYGYYTFLRLAVTFVAVLIAAGTPPLLAVVMLAYFSNLSAALTHYGTTTAPIYFGANYVTQREWWRLGLIVSFATITIWTTSGLVWWKVLGWW